MSRSQARSRVAWESPSVLKTPLGGKALTHWGQRLRDRAQRVRSMRRNIRSWRKPGVMRRLVAVPGPGPGAPFSSIGANPLCTLQNLLGLGSFCQISVFDCGRSILQSKVENPGITQREENAIAVPLAVRQTSGRSSERPAPNWLAQCFPFFQAVGS
jgi:hypothetical protein